MTYYNSASAHYLDVTNVAVHLFGEKIKNAQVKIFHLSAVICHLLEIILC